MAFTGTSLAGFSQRQEVITLVNATTVFSSVIDFLKIRRRLSHHTTTVLIQASAVTGTNVDVNLYGSDTEAGTTKRLLDADFVTALTDNAEAVATLDFGATPWPYYFFRFETDADETANTVTLTFLTPALEL